MFVVSPIVKGWQMKPGIDLVSLDELTMKTRELLN
jgi:hypothetical protein